MLIPLYPNAKIGVRVNISIHSTPLGLEVIQGTQFRCIPEELFGYISGRRYTPLQLEPQHCSISCPVQIICFQAKGLLLWLGQVLYPVVHGRIYMSACFQMCNMAGQMLV